MKELIKELVRLAVLTAIVTIAFFGFVGFVALSLEGIDFLPQYIGGFGTFMLYSAVYALIISLIIKCKK